MEFSLSDDQTMFQGSVSGYLASASALDTVRKFADGDAAIGDSVSNGLAELGVSQILVPETMEGLGLGLLDAALVQEAIGAAVAPARHLANAMAIAGLHAADSREQAAQWLPRIAAGEARFGVAMSEHVGAREGAGVVHEGGKLNGKSLFAMETAGASHILVADTAGHLHIVASDADGLSRRQLVTIDRTRDFAELVFKDVACEPLVGCEGANAADQATLVGRLLLAADTLGAAQVMLDKAVEYAKERKQFNRVIGSFQSVKHLCAEMAAQIEPARALVWHAAHAFDEGMEEAEVMICLAKSHLAEVGTFVARTSTEVHGGMGFTDLVGLHYWFKRIGTNRQLLGGPEAVREEAARRQGWA